MRMTGKLAENEETFQAALPAPDPGAVIDDDLLKDLGDPLFAQAVEIYRQNGGHIRVSWLQRGLRIGYSRAARLMAMVIEKMMIQPDGQEPHSDPPLFGENGTL